MATSTHLVALCMLNVLIRGTTAYCYISKSLSETLMTGEVRNLCVFNGVRMEVGSNFVTASCERCSCTKHGLSCCGIGYRAGAIHTFPGCEIIGDGCDPLSVKSCDNTVSCETGKPIRNTFVLHPGLKP
ncbi:uncharacterized protein [Argopecten irradians]|uniref:uncharacterized protein n=1 Tax=Argopecten irradians TaxID=31199 RepID=UPI003717996E